MCPRNAPRKALVSRAWGMREAVGRWGWTGFLLGLCWKRLYLGQCRGDCICEQTHTKHPIAGGAFLLFQVTQALDGSEPSHLLFQPQHGSVVEHCLSGSACVLGEDCCQASSNKAFPGRKCAFLKERGINVGQREYGAALWASRCFGFRKYLPLSNVMSFIAVLLLGSHCWS